MTKTLPIDAAKIDRLVECATFLTMVMGGPDGQATLDDEQHWFWGVDEDDDDDEPTVVLVLGKDVRIDIDQPEDGLLAPQFLTIIGWCAIHAVPCSMMTIQGRRRYVIVADLPDVDTPSH